MKKFLFVLCLAGLVAGIGITSSGGGYSQHAKLDVVSGNTSSTRLGGGMQPVASFGVSGDSFCGRLGILDPVKCLVSGGGAPSNVSGGASGYGCPEDFRLISNKVGLRRLNWLKRGHALNIGLPPD